MSKTRNGGFLHNVDNKHAPHIISVIFLKMVGLETPIHMQHHYGPNT